MPVKLSRRDFCRLTGAAAGYAALQPLACTKKSLSPPNILLIYADDLGYGDLSCYGGDIPTPHIDSIAESGIRFSQFYVSSPACTPSRYSLLTGCYPHRSRHGLDKVYMPGDDIHFDVCETTLAELVKERGYRTALFGKWHLGKAKESYLPLYHGFDHFCGMPGGCVDYYRHTYGPQGRDWYVDNQPAEETGYATELIADHALDYLRQQKPEGDPFFVYLAFNAPHYGKSSPDDLPPNTLSLIEYDYQGQRVMNTLQAPVEYLERFAYISSPARRYYSAMVASMDDQVGRVLRLLDERGLRDNTLIWFISDNGGYSISYDGHADNGGFRGEKATVYEGGIRIPALVSWKGRLQPEQVNDQVLCTWDLMPTLGSLIGFQNQLQQLPIDGRDVSDALLNRATVADRPLFFSWDNKNALRYGKWKLVHETELYDLENDPEETVDLAKRFPAKAAELLEMQKTILAYPPYRCDA
ncbi:sulfatase-like hydrolase/transferase [candidate division KSB1 bacterium]|nr:sulfatase-like hydrolase/transferase [candidate division KSB1 bacterium]